MGRRLIAILAVDGVAFSRLVARDEEAALSHLDQCRAAFATAVENHRGQVFAVAGDGFLAEFGSPVEALRAAVDFQSKTQTLNDAVLPEMRMPFRAGLNIGDVVVDDDFLRGEAVNVAVRLEGICEPGGVLVSGSFYEQVRHLPEFAFSSLGSRRLKNIATPVRVFALNQNGLVSALHRWSRRWKNAAMVTAAVLLAGILVTQFFWEPHGARPVSKASLVPVIAVLPFENLSRDADQEYFSDGVTNDVTTDLSKFSNVAVIASNSAFTLKGKPMKAQEIGRVLGVNYFVEGSVWREADRVRVNAQLIDAATGTHVWADRYDRKLGDVFDVQDEITQRIVKALAVEVDSAQLDRVRAKETSNMSAYENVLRGVAIITDPQKFTREGTAEGRAYYEKAIKLDPAYGRAYAELAYTFVRDVEFGWADDPDATLDKAEALARRAIELSGEYEGHWFLGQILSTRGQFEQSLAEYETARRLNSNDADLAANHGEALVYGGESARAIEMIEGAIKRNPEVPYWYWWNLAWAYYMVGRYEDAVKEIDKISDPPVEVLVVKASAKAQLGDEKGAAADMEQFMKARPDWTLENAAALHFRDDKDRQHWLDGLRKAGLREK